MLFDIIDMPRIGLRPPSGLIEARSRTSLSSASRSLFRGILTAASLKLEWHAGIEQATATISSAAASPPWPQ
jgi:hypothetical protein